MGQTVKLRRSAVSGRVPNNSQLQLGELSMNTTDGKIFLAKSGSEGPSIEEVIITNTQNTGSLDIVGSISGSFLTGSFIGDGSGLYNIPASGVTGLSLDKISSGASTASIGANGLQINVNTSITGSLTATEFTGSGLGLTNVPINVSGSDANSITYDGQFTQFLFDDSTGIKVSGDTSTGTAKIYLDGVAAENDGGIGVTAKLEVTGATSTWTFDHGLGEQYPAITVFDSDGYVIIPQNVEAVSPTQLVITFSSPQTGVATATIGGGLPAISSSYGGRLLTVNSDGTFAEWKESIYLQTGSFETYTSSVNDRFNSIESFTSSIDETYATDEDVTDLRNDLNLYTSSTDDRLDSLETTSGSHDGRLDSLETTTGSLDGRLDTIETTFSTSVNQRLINVEGSTEDNADNFMSYTSSTDDRLDSLETESGSIRTTLNSYTSSANGRLDNLENGIDDLRIESGSIRTDFNSYTSSTDDRLDSIENTTGSHDDRLDSLETTSGSHNTRIGNLETFESKVDNGLEFTGSNVTIKGNLLVKGTETRVDSTTVDLSDNIISLNGSGAVSAGIEVRDTTSPGLLSGSLIWDSTNNYWLGGTKSNEERLLTNTDLTNLDGRLDSLETDSGSIRTDFNSYTSSNDNNINGIDGRLGSLETTSGSHDGRLDSIESKTGSFLTSTNLSNLEGRVGSLETTSGSHDGRLDSLETESSSIRTTLNSYTSSANSRLNSLEVTSGSHDGRLDSLESFTSSIDDTYATDQDVTDLRGDFNTYTSSNDTTNTTQNSRLTSLESATGSYTTTDYYTTGATFNQVNGVVTGTRNDGGTWTVDLDGRYLTGYTETDPIFSASPSANITDTNIENWNTAYGWGDHAQAGYLTSHPNVVAATSSNNGGRTYIQDILLDSNGHVTGLTTSTETVVNTDEYTTGVTWNGTTAVLTFTRNDGDTYSVTMLETLSDVTVTGGTYNSGTQTLRLTKSDGSTVDVSGFAVDTDTNWYTTGATFNQVNGILTITGKGMSDVTVDLDGRYLTSYNDEYTTGATFNQVNGVVTFTRNDGDTFTVDLDGRYLTGYTETDPIFSASPSANITDTNIENWNTAYGWGDHSQAGYLTSYTETDTLQSVTSRGSTTTNTVTVGASTHRGGTLQVNDYNSNTDGMRIYGYSNNEILSLISRYDQADGGLFFKRGNNGSESTIGEINWVSNQFRINAQVGSLAIMTGGFTAMSIDSNQVVSLSSGLNITAGNIDMGTNTITDAKIGQWDTAYGWGDHSQAGYLTSYNNEYVTGATFNTGNGIITFTRNDGDTFTVDIDGKYAESGHNHDSAYVNVGGDTMTGTLDVHVGDTGTILSSGNASATGTPDQFFIKHVNGGVAIGNLRGDINFTNGSLKNDGNVIWDAGDFTSTNISNWNTAYGWGDHSQAGYLTSYNNEYVTGASWNSSTAVLTFTRNDGDTFNVTLLDTLSDVTVTGGTYDSGTQTLELTKNDGSTISVSGFAIDTDINYYLTGSTFNTSDGVLTLKVKGSSDVTVDLDGRYVNLSGGTITRTSTHVTQGSISASNAHLDLYNDWESDTDQKGSILTFTDNYYDGVTYRKTLRSAIKGGTDTTGNTADGYLEFYVDSAGANSPNLVLRLDRNKNAHFSGTITTTSHGSSSNWKQAYDWGDHAQAGYLTSYNNEYVTGATWNSGNGIITFTRNDGDTFTVDIDGRYLTSYTETDTLDSVVARGNTTARGITLGSGAPWTPLVINASAGEGTANAGVAIALDGTDYAEYGYRFKANGSNYYQVLYNGSSINWKHYSSGYSTKMSLSNGGNLTLTGTISASGYNDSNWNTAYGWGDHSQVGYLTSYTETDTLATVTARGASTSTEVSFNGAVNLNSTVRLNPNGTNFEIDTDANDRVLFSFNKSGTRNWSLRSEGGNLNFYRDSGTGSIQISGNNIATQSWVTSQNYLTSYNNEYTTGATFNTGNGIITFTRNDGDTFSVDIDGRFLTSYTETDTLNTVTSRGSTTSNSISVGDFQASHQSAQDATTKAEMLSMAVAKFKPHSTNSGTLAIAQVDSGNSVGLQFTNGAGTADWDMSLQPFGGNVGINKINPSGALHVYSGTSERFLISGDVHVQGSTDLNINGTSRRFSFTSGTGTIRTTTANALYLQTNSTTAVTIDANQNVAIVGTLSASGYNKTNWDTAYGWGDHSQVGYTNNSFAETMDQNVTTTSSPQFRNVYLQGTANPTLFFNGSADAGIDMAIKATPEGLDFYEPEDGNKVHFQILDDIGVNAAYGLQVGGTSVISSSRVLQNVSGNISMFTNDSGYVTNDEYVTGASWNNSTAVLTFTRNDGDTFNVTLLDTLSDVTVTGGTYNSGTQTLTLTKSDGNTVDVSGFAIDTDVNYYTTGATFSTSNGVITGTLNNGATWTVDIDDRYLQLGGGVLTGNIGRSAHNNGFLVGGYNNVGVSASATNPIFTIGTSYLPAVTTLGNMYGIGYTRADASFMGIASGSGWGMYVAADGDARIWLDGSSGNIVTSGTLSASGYNDSNWNTAYGWGDHAQAGYLTSFDITTQTDGKYLRSDTNDNFTGRLTNNSMNETPSYDKGAINLQPSASGGSIGITFRSKVNSTSDAGYIWWYDDNDHYNELNSTENGVLLIAVQNDGGATSEDAIALESSGDIYLNAGVASGAIGSGVWDSARGNVYLGYAGDRARVLSTDDGNPTQWNTAYGWGDHAGRYMTEGLTLTGINTIVNGGNRYDPSTDNPTNEHYAVLTYGNGGNVTGQLATHFQTGKLYSRGHNNSWSGWRAYWSDSDFTSTNVSNWNTAYGWGDHSAAGYVTDITTQTDGKYLRSDTNDSFTGQITMSTQKAFIASDYGHGVYGRYSDTRYQHVWGMGTSWNMSSDGTGLGNFYGLAYTHTNIGGESKPGLSHQTLFVENGDVKTAIGRGIWTDGTITTTGHGNSSQWNTAYGWGDHSQAGYQASGNYFTDGDTVLNMANNDGLVYDDTSNIMYVKLDGSNYEIIHSNSIGSQSVNYANEAKWISFPDGPRDLSDRLPNWNNRSVAWDFVTAGTASGSGNYAGVMTFSPWDGTSSSTGDSSYQLAFVNITGVNASGIPGLRLRNGIDASWNPWYTLWHSGNDGSGSGLDSDLLDGQHGSYYTNAGNLTGTIGDVFSEATRYNIGLIDGNSSQTRDKIRVWTSSEYSIGMKNGYDYGHIGSGEYAMSFQMSNTAGRGWWWGDSAHTDDQGAASLTTEGKMVIAKSLSIGQGESITNPSDTPLYVEGTVSGSTVFEVQGTQGQLFSITDSLVGDIFEVSDISGIPILSVNSNGVVTIDDTLHVTGDVFAYYSSDERLKDNVRPIENSIEKIKMIGGYEFDWNDQSRNNTGHDVGVIAQEIEKVLPEVVGTRGDGFKGVKYEKLTALLIQVNKELIQRVEELETILKNK